MPEILLSLILIFLKLSSQDVFGAQTTIPPAKVESRTQAPRLGSAIFPDLDDRAEFILIIDEHRVLTNRVVWKSKTSFESGGEGMLDGDRVQMSTEIRCDAVGKWTTLRLKMPIHSTAIYRKGDKAGLVQPDGTTNSVTLRDDVLPFPGLEGMNLFTMYYDSQTNGTQILPVIVPHKKPREVSVRLTRSFETRIENAPMLLREFEIILGDELTASVLVDIKGRLIRSEMPSDHAVFIRKEFLFLNSDKK